MEVSNRYTDIVKDISESPAKFGNVGYVYATNLTSDFTLAVKRYRLADAISKDDITGIAQQVDKTDRL